MKPITKPLTAGLTTGGLAGPFEWHQFQREQGNLSEQADTQRKIANFKHRTPGFNFRLMGPPAPEDTAHYESLQDHLSILRGREERLREAMNSGRSPGISR